MLHSRYFCTYNTNNLFKILAGINNETLTNKNKNEIIDTSVPDFTKSLKTKRKSNDIILNETSKRKTFPISAHLTPNQNTNNVIVNEQENMYANYFRKLLSTLTENDSINFTNQIKQLFNANQLSTMYQYPFNNKIMEAYTSSDMTSLLNLVKPNHNNINVANFYQNIASNYQHNIAQFQQHNQQYQNGNFSNMILTYLDMRSKLLNETYSDTNNSPHQSEPSSPCLIVPTTLHQSLVQPQFQYQCKNSPQAQNQLKTDQEIITKETCDLNSSANSSANQTESKITDFQSIQNWCAKCNTHFRLTSDLVYHMRTFHRKEDPTFTNSKLSKLPMDFSKKQSITTVVDQTSDDKFNNNKRDFSKYLRCEICNELFKEKHHLRRHLTSHR